MSGLSPAGVEEHVDERGGDGRQSVRVQRHDAELVLGDQHRVNCGVDGWENKKKVLVYKKNKHNS